MLFSEPKIPQLFGNDKRRELKIGFSALQRAENSSIETPPSTATRSFRGFSALQRAENSSIPEYGVLRQIN